MPRVTGERLHFSERKLTPSATQATNNNRPEGAPSTVKGTARGSRGGGGVNLNSRQNQDFARLLRAAHCLFIAILLGRGVICYYLDGVDGTVNIYTLLFSIQFNTAHIIIQRRAG
jgi:hypothetical protein